MNLTLLWRNAAAVLAIVTLAGCAASEHAGMQRREAVTRDIVADAMAYNEAYHRAIASQVLLNVLRASNRQPRQYTSMSGFTQDGGRRGASLTVGGVDLGRLGQSWGEGEFSADASAPLAPDFTVSPFATGAFANIVLRPVDAMLFRYYWDSGWNPDLLLMLLVDRVRIAPADGGPVRDLRNSASTIANDCTGANDEGGCAFVLEMRELALELSRAERVAAPAPAQGECGAFAVYVAPGTSPRPPPSQAPANAAPANPACPTEIVVAGRRYLMALRSLDDIVYYVGHLMRPDPNAAQSAPPHELRARLGVTAPGFPMWAGERTPLFRIVEASSDGERGFAAAVTYAGRRYAAGAPVSRFCYVEGDVSACHSGEYLDMSGTVLELLAGILAFNQSAEVVAPPQNSLLQVR